MGDRHLVDTVTGVRAAAAALALIWALLGIGWRRGDGWAAALWPWPEAAMSFVLLSAIAAFIAMVWLNLALGGETAPLAGVGLSIAIASAGAAAHLWTLGWRLPTVLALAVLAIGFALLAWAGRQPVRDARAMPSFVRLAFAVFTAVLVAAGGALVWQVQILPWPLHPSTMVIVGAIFVGAAAYFAHAAWQTRWVFAAPPLWGFLAYDLVLCAPYLKLLVDGNAVVDDYGGSGINMTSLIVYLLVLASSAAVAVVALFMHPATRVSRRLHAAPP